MPTTALRNMVVVPHAEAHSLTSWTIALCIRLETDPAGLNRLEMASKGNADIGIVGQRGYEFSYEESLGGVGTLSGAFRASGATHRWEATYTLTVGRWYALATGYDAATGDWSLLAATMAAPRAVGSGSYTEIDSGTLSGPPTPQSTIHTFEIGHTQLDATFAEVCLYTGKIAKATLDARIGRRLTGDEAGLVGYWPLEEGSGATVAGHGGYDGAVYVDEPARWVDGPLDLYYTGIGKAETSWLGYASATMRPRATLTASDADADYPVSRLRNPRQHLTTRTTGV